MATPQWFQAPPPATHLLVRQTVLDEMQTRSGSEYAPGFLQRCDSVRGSHTGSSWIRPREAVAGEGRGLCSNADRWTRICVARSRLSASFQAESDGSTAATAVTVDG